MVNGANSEASGIHTALARGANGARTTEPRLTLGANNYNPITDTKD